MNSPGCPSRKSKRSLRRWQDAAPPAPLPAAAEDSAATLEAARAIAALGVDFIKVGLQPGEPGEALVEALADIAGTTRLVAVEFADRERDPARILPRLVAAGFAGVMLDTADKSGGRLLKHIGVPALASFVKAAREHGLIVGLAGGLEEPDVPRLLALQPDFLGFRGALCAGGQRGDTIDLERVKAIRRLIPPADGNSEARVDYRLLSARGYHPETDERDRGARVFVRDFVLPVRIGAYSHERAMPQKVRFDVTAEIDRARGEPQGMGQVYSYDLITDAISAIVAGGHIDFVETLAERVAGQVLRDARVRRVTVRVEKTEMGPGGVGVELTLDRPEAAAVENPVLAMLDAPRKPR